LQLASAQTLLAETGKPRHNFPEQEKKSSENHELAETNARENEFFLGPHKCFYLPRSPLAHSLERAAANARMAHRLRPNLFFLSLEVDWFGVLCCGNALSGRKQFFLQVRERVQGFGRKHHQRFLFK